MKAKKWVLVKHFHGEPQDDNLELVEEELPELKQNGFNSTYKFNLPSRTVK